MGTDINGWIEARTRAGARWAGVARLSPILDRDYDVFGSLFGVQNFAGFSPIAEGRGMPVDASDEARAEYLGWGDEDHDASWIAATELAAIDWGERAGRPDARLHQYEPQASGEPRYVGKAGWPGRSVAGATGAGGPGDPIPIPADGAERRVDGVIYRAETMARIDATNPSFDLVLRWVADLASRYGAENVRMVVWFDT